MVALFLFAALNAQAPAPAAMPAVKVCPDQSIILAMQTCAELPDHRYLQPHQPEIQLQSAEWTCGDDKRPSSASIKTKQIRGGTSKGARPPDASVELVTLTVKGRRPDGSTVRLLREKLAGMTGVSSLSGECLYRRGLGTKSVLTVRGSKKGYSKTYVIEVELE